MVNILIDPVIVMTPAEQETREGVEQWLLLLQIWLKEALQSPHHWYHAKHVTFLLDTLGRFPNFKVIQKWQQHYQLDINPARLARDVHTFFRNEEGDLQTILEQMGYLIEVQKDSTCVFPEHVSARWLPVFFDEMLSLLAFASMYKYMGHPFAQELSFVTSPLPEVVEKMEIHTRIETSVPDIFTAGEEEGITQDFPLLVTPRDLVAHIDVVALWNEGEQGVIYAIEQVFFKMWQQTVPSPYAFRLGPGFLGSMNEHFLNTNEPVLSKIIRYAASVIADQAKYLNCDLRPLRETKAAESPQRTRREDHAKAWRLTLTDQGVGWRMQYWQIPTAQGCVIEFANIVKKNDPEKICS